MPHSQIDHITIAASVLASGVELVHRSLGVRPQVGGEHPRMGTHNALLRLGDSVYLEVIAPNPQAPRPARPRWFGLDQLDPDAPPRLATWAVRTTDIRSTVAGSSEPLGTIEPMTRGELSWLITIPSDGSLPFGGLAPVVIEWPPAVQVARKLDDVGCALVKLEGFHPDAPRLSALLKSISVDSEAISVSPLPAGRRPYLVAHIRTPKGLATLSGA